MTRKSTIVDARRLVKKWAAALGFGHYRMSVLELQPDSEFWAVSRYSHEDEVAVIGFDTSAGMSKGELEFITLHELAHGIIELANLSPAHLETACNRIARLALGEECEVPNEPICLANVKAKDGNRMQKTSRELLVDVCIDMLPADEKQVIEGLFFERVSLGEMARRMDSTKGKVRYLAKRGMARLEEMLRADIIEELG